MKHINTYQLFESVHDTKEQIEEIVSTCKDILLEANSTFSSNSNVEKSYKDDKVIITCFYTAQFINIKAKSEEYKSTMYDIHERLIDYMTAHGFTYNNRGDRYTAYFDMMLGNITYNISFSKQLDREFIGHLRYLKKYNIKESNSNWIEVNGKLQYEFEFSDFLESLNFINKIAQICESENHHPEINWTYNKITLKLSTHDAGDIITEKDIKLSKLIDEVLKTL
jgi:4a-hydroxytetrahydrobiopterin dehydratase